MYIERAKAIAKMLGWGEPALTNREIVALLNEIPAADVVKRERWVSVEERLPEKHTRVLCYFKYEPESPNVICENLYHGDGSWLGNGNLVTHWMPLPEPPEGGAE